MAYNAGTQEYLDPTNSDFGAVKWIQFLVDNQHITPEKAMAEIHWGGEDVENFQKPGVIQWGNDQTLINEIGARFGKASGEESLNFFKSLSPGEAFQLANEQLRIDTIKAWNSDPKHTDALLPSTAEFGNQDWWIDSNRDPVSSGTLAPYPEAEAAAQQIADAFHLPGGVL